MAWAQKQRAGFTIVELLIVIVILGILILLAYSGFAGAQQRARNIRTVANVRQFYTAVKAFQADTGVFPTVEPTEGYTAIKMVCIGLGYPSGDCGEISGTAVLESSHLYAQFDASAINVNREIVNVVSGGVGNESFTGAAYGIDTVTGGGFGRTIQWFLEGPNANCQVAESYAYNTASGNTACEIILERL